MRRWLSRLFRVTPPAPGATVRAVMVFRVEALVVEHVAADALPAVKAFTFYVTGDYAGAAAAWMVAVLALKNDLLHAGRWLVRQGQCSDLAGCDWFELLTPMRLDVVRRPDWSTGKLRPSW